MIRRGWQAYLRFGRSDVAIILATMLPLGIVAHVVW